jgi:hypothetical protein
MTMPVFPTYAVLLAQNISVAPATNAQRSEFESGHIRQVPINTLERTEITVSYKLCGQDDYQAFREWVRLNGAQWFLWQNPDKYQQTRGRIVKGEVRYTPSTKNLSHWQASMTIEHL